MYIFNFKNRLEEQGKTKPRIRQIKKYQDSLEKFRLKKLLKTKSGIKRLRKLINKGVYPKDIWKETSYTYEDTVVTLLEDFSHSTNYQAVDFMLSIAETKPPQNIVDICLGISASHGYYETLKSLKKYLGMTASGISGAICEGHMCTFKEAIKGVKLAPMKEELLESL